MIVYDLLRKNCFIGKNDKKSFFICLKNLFFLSQAKNLTFFVLNIYRAIIKYLEIWNQSDGLGSTAHQKRKKLENW